MAPCKGTATGSESGTKRSLEPPQEQKCADDSETNETVLFLRPSSHRAEGAARWNIENKRRSVGNMPSAADFTKTASTSIPEAVLGTSPTILAGEAERMDETSSGRDGEKEGGRNEVDDLFHAEELMSSVVDGLRGAAEGVTPVSRRADGRFQIDGNELLNLVRLMCSKEQIY